MLYIKQKKGGLGWKRVGRKEQLELFVFAKAMELL